MSDGIETLPNKFHGPISTGNAFGTTLRSNQIQTHSDRENVWQLQIHATLKLL